MYHPSLAPAHIWSLKFHAYEMAADKMLFLGKSDIKLNRPQSARAAVQPSGLHGKNNENNGL